MRARFVLWLSLVIVSVTSISKVSQSKLRKKKNSHAENGILLTETEDIANKIAEFLDFKDMASWRFTNKNNLLNDRIQHKFDMETQIKKTIRGFKRAIRSDFVTWRKARKKQTHLSKKMSPQQMVERLINNQVCNEFWDLILFASPPFGTETVPSELMFSFLKEIPVIRQYIGKPNRCDAELTTMITDQTLNVSLKIYAIRDFIENLILSLKYEPPTFMLEITQLLKVISLVNDIIALKEGKLSDPNILLEKDTWVAYAEIPHLKEIHACVDEILLSLPIAVDARVFAKVYELIYK